MTAEPKRVLRHVAVRGRVQGVGYRAWTEHEALTRGLEGFVRNCRDGSVEALFAGPEAVVAEMVEACRQGPRGARITGLDATDAEPDALRHRRPGERFSVLPTA